MELQGDASTVFLCVGGIAYTLNLAALIKFPRSFFAKLSLPVWSRNLSDPENPLVIERDGIVFQYIYDFLRYGTLPRDTYGRIMMDKSTRIALLAEADFFQLPEIASEFAVEDSKAGLASCLKTHRDVSDIIRVSKKAEPSTWSVPSNIVCLDGDDGEPDLSDDENYHRACVGADCSEYTRFSKLLREITAPFCVVDVIENPCEYSKVYKSSNMKTLNIEELLADATLSAFGKGAETVIDTNVRHSYEIDLSKERFFCGPSTYEFDISKLAPDSKLKLIPYKLVIYKEGGHFEAHRDTVRAEGHIGTLVLILNSAYTGGELEVSHGGRTEVVTGAYSWVAMYGDCLHKINPVTSGTRVSLIYDICQDKRNRSYCRELPWEVDYLHRTHVQSYLRDINEAQRAAVVAGMHQQLQGFESAVICLQHLYPACQATPDFLKGGDQLLYELLQRDFHLAVLPCTIYRKTIDSFMGHYGPKDAVFCIKPMWLKGNLASAEHVSLTQEAAKLKTNVILVDKLLMEHVLEKEQIDYTGNDAQGEETVYMVAGLQVRGRK